MEESCLRTERELSATKSKSKENEINAEVTLLTTLFLTLARGVEEETGLGKGRGRR